MRTQDTKISALEYIFVFKDGEFHFISRIIIEKGEIVKFLRIRSRGELENFSKDEDTNVEFFLIKRDDA